MDRGIDSLSNLIASVEDKGFSSHRNAIRYETKSQSPENTPLDADTDVGDCISVCPANGAG